MFAHSPFVNYQETLLFLNLKILKYKIMKKKPLIEQVTKACKKPIRIMKLTFIFTVLCMFQSFAGVKGQSITVSVKETEISKVLTTIEKQSDYRFLFNSRLKDLKQKITLSLEDQELNIALAEIFAGTNLTFKKITSNLVAIRSTDPAEQDVKITGRITSDAGEPLSGVSVLIKGTTKGTTTDNNGNFSLVVPDNATLLISAIGYEAQEMKVGSQTVLAVKLVQATKKIDEVVVIGYGSASKRDLTGSIVKIAGKDVADKPNTNPVASLQGKVAGLSVVNNGTPGKAPDIRIRGTISIGSVKPLYVVDGVFNDNIDYINPNDIESIEILKDPSSLAIFGVRGAAGVIAITTKKAKAGQVIINYNNAFGTKKLVDKIGLASAEEFKTLYEEEKVNIGANSPFDYTLWTANTDWIDAVTRVGHFNSHNLSMSGSTEKNKFTMGMGYTSDEGLIRHEKLEKILFSLSDEFRLSKAIRVGFNFNGVRQNNPYDPDDYAQNALNDARKVIPIVPSGTKTFHVRNPYGLDSLDQNLYYELPSIQNSGVVNPLIRLENEWNKKINIEYRTVASAFAEVNFLRDFSFKTTLYADLSNVNKRRYTPLYYSYDLAANQAFLISPATKIKEDDDTYKKFQQDHILNYKRKFGNHSINAVAGFTTYYFGKFSRGGTVNQSSTG